LVHVSMVHCVLSGLVRAGRPPRAAAEVGVLPLERGAARADSRVRAFWPLSASRRGVASPVFVFHSFAVVLHLSCCCPSMLLLLFSSMLLSCLNLVVRLSWRTGSA